MGWSGKIARALGLYGRVDKSDSGRNFEGTGVIGYESAREDPRIRGRNVNTHATPKNYLRSDLDEIRALAQDAERNDPLVNSIIQKITRGVVGATGFLPRCNDSRYQREADEVIALIEAQSRRANFSADGQMTRAEFVRLAIRHIIRDGEVLIRRHRRFKNEGRYALQMVDVGYMYTERTGAGVVVDGNKVDLGVENDEFGRPLAYWFRGDPNNPLSAYTYFNGGGYTRHKADDFIHLFFRQYSEQPRGVSFFAPVLDLLEMVKRYRKSEVHAARVGSALHIVGKTTTGGAVGGDRVKFAAEGSKGVYDAKKGKSNFVVNVNDPEMLHLDSDKELNVINSGHPTKNYPDFVAEVYRAICSCLDVPYPIVTGDWTAVNYSSGQLFSADYTSRLQRFQEMMKQLEDWWARDFIWQCMRDGRCSLAPTRFEEVMDSIKWNPAIQPPAEPMKAAKANEILIGARLKSRRQAMLEMGLDPDEQEKEIEAEEKKYGPPATPKPGRPADEDEEDGEDAPNKGKKGDDSKGDKD